MAFVKSHRYALGQKTWTETSRVKFIQIINGTERPIKILLGNSAHILVEKTGKEITIRKKERRTLWLRYVFYWRFFLDFFFLYVVIQHCFIAAPQISLYRRILGSNPRLCQRLPDAIFIRLDLSIREWHPRVQIFCYVLLPGVMNVADQGDKKKSSQQLLMRYPPQAEKYMG